MKREFVQVRPDNGYLIHAVDADQEGTGLWSMKGPICGRIRVRDAQRYPNLRFQKHEGARKPFTATMLHDIDVSVCVKCAERVMQASG